MSATFLLGGYLLKDLIILGRDASETTFKVIISGRVSMQPGWPNVKYFPVDLGMVQEIEDDKRRVTETGISRLLRERPALAKYRNELLSKLCTSGTTFSDLCLGLEHLRTPRFASTPALIRKELEILPWSPQQITEDILERIPEERHWWAVKALPWVLHAVRPLKLDELAAALAI
jgi:hypothetical protein